MTVPRENPYIWTTWLPRLLTGENSCEWAVWFKAHHQGWTRQPSQFDQTQWLLDHTDLLNEQKAQWEANGHEARVERQNSFQLRGRTATLAGQPDLIVDRGNDALIIDVKSGQEQPWHTVQLMIYQYALPKASDHYSYAKLAGEVVYPNRTARVPRGALPDQFINNLGTRIRRIAAATPPKRVPSPRECRFCDISAADCPERIETGSEPEDGTATDF